MEGKRLRKVLGLVGPTGVGKTSVAIELCRRLEGEIVSCDSRQIYRKLDIGTAKPNAEEQSRAKHHLIDVIEIDQSFSAHKYRELADAAIEDIFMRGKQPLVVGGTGLYYKALTEGFFEVPDSDEKLRQKLEDEFDQFGNEYMWEKLAKVDKQAAMKITRSDRFRIIRALEIFFISGATKSELSSSGNYPRVKYNFVTFGLNMPRKELYRRINSRVDSMLESGWIDETERLISGSMINSRNKRKLMGYNYLYDYLEGRIACPECVEKIKQSHRNYAKRQLTWFRRVKILRWFSATDSNIAEKIMELFN